MNPMTILQMLFGDRANEMMSRWNSMSPEQKQAEMQRISGMSKEQGMQYLQGMGLDPNILTNIMQQQPQTQTPPQQNNSSTGGNRFNY